ncbi:MAG: adenylate kinase [Acidimicrobiia bacterium]
MKRGARLVILGKQGAGKGTQGERLCRHFNTQHLSTGQLFRDSAAVGIPAGLEAKAFMDRGELVPDEIVVDVVEERFSNPAEVEHGFVLDGFPRTENQAEELDRILGASNPLDLVVDLDVPTDMAIERLLGRGREDDNGESIRRRLELYEQETKPLIDLYRKRGLLVQVDGVGEEDEVFKRLLDAIDARGAII